MKVTEAIVKLQGLADAGYGDCLVRVYSELADETYPPIKAFAVRKPREYSDDPYTYYNETWVEVR